jgi:hypothetical protein
LKQGVLELQRSRSRFVLGTSALRTVIISLMLRRWSRLSLLSVLLLAAACSTTRPRNGPLRVPAPAQKSTPSPNESRSKPAVGEYAVLIDSEPAGGVVVINGVPVGRTPQRVVLSGTSRGFFRDAVSIKVRFVAADTDHTSQTIEEQLTPLDKIPASVHFTLAGATRVAR